MLGEVGENSFVIMPYLPPANITQVLSEQRPGPSMFAHILLLHLLLPNQAVHG